MRGIILKYDLPDQSGRDSMHFTEWRATIGGLTRPSWPCLALPGLTLASTFLSDVVGLPGRRIVREDQAAST